MIELDFEKIANESSQKVEEKIAFGENYGDVWIVTTTTSVETTCRLATDEDKKRLGIYEVLKKVYKPQRIGYDIMTGTNETRTDKTRDIWEYGEGSTRDDDTKTI